MHPDIRHDLEEALKVTAKKLATATKAHRELRAQVRQLQDVVEDLLEEEK